MVDVKQGWYRDPTNSDNERFWHGTHWAKGARVASDGTREFPGTAEQAATENPPPRGFNAAADFLLVLAVLTALAAIAGGIYLITRSVDHCVPNPYNDAFGTDLEDCSKQHPLALSGASVIVAGAVQTAVLAIVARLCRMVQKMRDAA